MSVDEEFYKTICRVCLSPGNSESVVSLIDISNETGLSCYGEAVQTFANICIKKDSLPKFMCKKCLYLLKQAIIFKKKCENSQEILAKLVCNSDGESVIQEKIAQFVMFTHYFPDSCVEESNNQKIPVEVVDNACRNTSKICPKISRKSVKVENEGVEIDGKIDSDANDQFQDNSQNGSSEDEENNEEVTLGTSEDQEIENLLKGIEKAIKMSTHLPIKSQYKKNEKKKNQLKPEITRSKVKMSQRIQHKIWSRKNITCKICNVVVKNYTVYKRHLKRHKQAPTEMRNIQCKVCNKVLANIATYKCHIQQHTGFRYVCEHCAKGFAILAQLQYHQAAVHDIGQFYYCNQCDYKAARRWDLVVHNRYHTGERPYACDKCGLTFLRRFVWKKHALYHMEKTVQCPRCPKKFHQRGEMLAHANNVHERVYVYSCPECDVTYAKTGTVRRHLVEKHGIARETQGKIRRLILRKSSISKEM